MARLKNSSLNDNQQLGFVDITNIFGKHDLIISKSLLCEVFSESESTLNDVSEFMACVIR